MLRDQTHKRNKSANRIHQIDVKTIKWYASVWEEVTSNEDFRPLRVNGGEKNTDRNFWTEKDIIARLGWVRLPEAF